MKIGNVEIRRTYRPARIVCDVVTLAALVVVTKNAADLLMQTKNFLGFVGALPLLFPAAGIGMCAAYIILTFKSLKFKRYKITKQNAQNVYDWWAFSLSLVKVPLLLAMFEGEYQFLYWAVTGKSRFGIALLLYILLAVIIIRLMIHRIRSLTVVKKVQKDESTVKVKARTADEDKEN